MVLYVLYTDDSIITAPEEALIDAVINDIKNIGLKVTVEDTVADFLVVCQD